MILKTLNLLLDSILGKINVSRQEKSDNNLAHLSHNTAYRGFSNSKQVCDGSVMGGIGKQFKGYRDSMMHCNGFAIVCPFLQYEGRVQYTNS